ncbi:MAG TPA: type II toxin-antitoxin system RelE/ParE family toxin [Flavobacteriales bacterium]|jgi:plasmid stabilization system protein ParE|nr:type II toxin-antitoxin system RelE/ParE family toxin [Flavobacteriales bacterium]
MNVFVTADARRSLARTIRLLARTHSKTYLVKLRDEVNVSVIRLGQHPLSGAIELELEHLGKGHRRVIVGPFKIIYRITPKQIVVTDIFDSRRDPKGMKG